MAPLGRALLVAAALLGGGLVTGCKQAVGERCEIQDDCQSGLECKAIGSSSVYVCMRPTTGGADAAVVTVDAGAVDALVPDGPAPASDAPPPDAVRDTATDQATDLAPDSAADRLPVDGQPDGPLDAPAGS
jgi:hypothetical protein